MARRRRNPAWTLVAVATVAAALSVAWRTSDLGRAAADLPAQRAAARREGLPTRYADLKGPPVPLDENAAPLYAQAFVDFRAAKGLDRLNPEALLKAIETGTAKPEELAALRGRLPLLAPALAKATEGTRRPGFSFDRDWDLGSALTFPEYADGRAVVRALVLRAILAKRPEAAAEDLRAAARMRRDFGSERVLIAALVGDGTETEVLRGVRTVGRRGGAWTRAVLPVIDVLGPLPALRRSLGGEAAMGMNFDRELDRLGPSSFVTMDGDGESDGGMPLAWRALSIPAVRDASLARVFAYWRRAWATLPTDPTDYRAARTALRMPSEGGPSYKMLEVLLPVFDHFAMANAEVEANRRLTRAALELWSGRTPTLAKDPFGPGPIRFVRKGEDWTLYSLGPDERDDGGKPRQGSKPGYDLVVASEPRTR